MVISEKALVTTNQKLQSRSSSDYALALLLKSIGTSIEQSRARTTIMFRYCLPKVVENAVAGGIELPDFLTTTKTLRWYQYQNLLPTYLAVAVL
jgi:hypothetical protein